MKKIFVLIFGLIFYQNFGQTQVDSMAIRLELNPEEHTAIVEQDFWVYNRSNRALTEFYLHAWANAYSGIETILNEVKLEDRKTAIYWADRSERGGVDILEFNGFSDYTFEKREFLRLQLNEPLSPKGQLQFRIRYRIKIPSAEFTKYGYDTEGNYLLKYLFLQPTPLLYNEWQLQHFKDFESVAAYPSNIQLTFVPPTGYKVYTDLIPKENQWYGEAVNPFRLLVTKKDLPQYEGSTRVIFGFDLDDYEPQVWQSTVNKQLQFLTKKLGPVPGKQLFISSKTKKEQSFVGVDDVDIGIKTLRIFTEEEKTGLRLFQPISYEYIDRLFSSDRRKDHWIKNGIQVYLQIKYAQENFPELKLSGNMSDEVRIFGLRPLKYFHAAKLKLNDRYKLLYLYVTRRNFDQAINTPIDEMSNLNQVAISAFKTGMAFHYLSEYLGEEKFNRLIRGFADEYRGDLVNQNDFRNYMILNAPKDISWFFDDYIQDRRKVNFALQSAKEVGDSLALKIKNKTEFKGPFQISAVRNDSVVLSKWFESNRKKSTVFFPNGEYDKLVLNRNYLFPELNDRDNYIKRTGLFRNAKRFQFKLYNDIENPEYNQIFVVPQFRWNNYDKFQIGLNFHNRTPLTRAFDYKLSPKFSTGTGNITGGATLRYALYPDEGLFRSINFGGGFFSEHYAEDLRFARYSFGTSVSFNKPPRSERNHGFNFSFNHLDRDVPEGETQGAEDLYNLWDFGYFYNNPRKIHDIFGLVNFQTTETFQKIYSEIYYRWQVGENYRLGFRFFGGKFLQNNTDTDFFNFGTNFITDYTFSYSLLGRSERTGFLSQQFVLAEGGFKSDFDILVDDWLVATNFEIPVWKMFDVFVDAGFYKNEGQSAEFLYDTGIRLRLIPDFLELFFPIQSTLGFEPSLGNYHERIRWTLNFSLSRVISYIRRGWY